MGDFKHGLGAVSYTHLRAHETLRYLVCRLLLEKTYNEATDVLTVSPINLLPKKDVEKVLDLSLIHI